MAEFPVSLFAALMRAAPFQPATNLWRAVELTVLVEKAFPFIKESKTLLDMGCGDGEVMRVLRPFLPQNMFVSGVDPDEKECAAAQETGMYKAVFCCSGADMPFADGSQDALISNSVLEHIPDLEAVLAQSARVLKPDGWFIATVPGPDFHACLTGPWWPCVDRDSYQINLDRRLAHVRYLDEAAWRDVLGHAGLRIDVCAPYFSYKQVRRWELLSRLTGGLVSSLLRVRPIEAQRQLGLRRSWRLPETAALALARLLAAGLTMKEEEPFGCLLIVSRKDT